MAAPSFTAEIISAGAGGHAVVVPRSIAALFDSKRPPVLAHVNQVACRSRLMIYGGTSYLGLRKDLLRTLGVTAGDQVEITLELDHERLEQESAPSAPPTEPTELTEALTGNPAARAAYDALPPSHRAEYARWISEGQRAETRAERVAKTLRRLTAPR